MTPPLLCALSTALLLGVIDLRTGRMPNWVTLGSWGAALLVRGNLEGTAGVLEALAGSVTCAAAPAFAYFWSRGAALGGGDVKALLSVGAWLGPSLGIEVELLSFSLLAICGVLLETWRGRLGVLLAGVFGGLRRPRAGKQDEGQAGLAMRFGPYLAAGTVLSCGAAEAAQVPYMSWIL